MKKIALVVFVLLSIFLTFSQYCWSASPKNTLVVAANIDDIITLDPAETFEFTGTEILANVYDKLMMYEPEDLSTLVGGVAENWEVSENGKTITFTLREGLKFHSGNPVTAHDAAFSLQRGVLLKKTPSFILTQFGWNADNVHELVRAIDNKTLQLTITEDFAPSLVLNCLAAGIGSVVDKKLVLAHEKNGDMGHNWLRRHSAGGGAFFLKDWKPNIAVVLEANKEYRHGSPAVERVIFRHIKEATTQRLLLEKGDVDIAMGLNIDQLQAMKGDDDIVIRDYPQAAVHFLGLNQKTKELQNPKVWEALRWLVDYQYMTDTFLKGQYKVHQSFWPVGFPGSLTDTPYSYNVEKAKNLLTEAGYPDGFSLELDVINNPVFMNMAQAIQQSFAKADIKLNIIPGTGAQVITKYRDRAHDMLLIYWGPDFMDIHSNANSFAFNADNSDAAKVSSSAWRNAWDIPELSKRTRAAAMEKDSTKRQQMYLDIQKEIQQQSPYIIMFQANNQVAMKKEVKGFVMGPVTDEIYFRNVKKE